MARKYSAGEREYARQRVHSMFTEAENVLIDKLTPLRLKIQTKVMKEMGIDKIRDRIESVVKTLREMNTQYAEICGSHYIGRIMYNESGDNVPAVVRREVDRQLANAKESVALNQLKQFKLSQQDAIMLGSDGQLGELLQSLPEKINQLVPKSLQANAPLIDVSYDE